jgi:dTDP-glucose pyrophosphorylase
MIDKPLLPGAKLIDAVQAIELSSKRMVVVVDANNHLLGTITDGDIRRHLLKGYHLENQVTQAMNPNPIWAFEGESNEYIKKLLLARNVDALPILDSYQKYLRLVHLDELFFDERALGISETFSFAVIMAGGEGTRLRPLTEKIPKPMVEIGGVPLIERQIKRLAQVGIPRVYVAINYLGHIIEDHFLGQNDLGIEISFLREQKRLGTAGAISLLLEHPERSILVMNGDVLTTSNLDSFYRFHAAHDVGITVAAIDHRVNIPYGVIKSAGPFVKAITEKPSEQFLCNAGIYAISPKVLEFLPKDEFCNMTDLLEICLSSNVQVAVFPIHEFWSDVGTLADLQNARMHFSKMESS